MMDWHAVGAVGIWQLIHSHQTPRILCNWKASVKMKDAKCLVWLLYKFYPQLQEISNGDYYWQMFHGNVSYLSDLLVFVCCCELVED